LVIGRLVLSREGRKGREGWKNVYVQAERPRRNPTSNEKILHDGPFCSGQATMPAMGKVYGLEGEKAS
jgi:hypothetical protein